MTDQAATETDPQGNLAEAIGKEGTLAYLQGRVPKVRFNPETESLEEDKGTSEGKPPDKEEKPPEPSGKEKEAKPEEKPPESKFKTKEDAERAHAEAERKMHEATTVAAEEKKAREAVEKQLEETKKKLEEHLSKPPEKSDEKPPEPVVGEERKKRIKAATKSALAKIREFDRADPEYADQVDEAWTEALLEVSLSATALTKEEAERMVKQTLDAEKKAAEAAAAEQRKKDKEEADKQTWQTATGMATQAGLDMTPGSLDYITFRYVAETELGKQEFMKAENPPTLKTQVDWVVTEVRKKTGAKVQQTQEELEKARKQQEKNAVLAEGTKLNPPKEEPLTEPVSLAVLQRQMRDKQRARHRGD